MRIAKLEVVVAPELTVTLWLFGLYPAALAVQEYVPGATFVRE